MSQKGKGSVADLTVSELRELISRTVEETLDDRLEDLQALMSKKYVRSIRVARRQYRTGKVKRLKDVLDV